MNEYIDPRSRLAAWEGCADERRTSPRPIRHRSACSRSGTCAPITGRSYFGIQREVRAVDDVSLQVDRDEIYGLAGESSCGKTTLIKTIARAIRPPLNVVGGSVNVQFRAAATATSMR